MKTIVQEHQEKNGLEGLSTNAIITGMEEGSAKHKRPKIMLEALKVNIEKGKYLSALHKQPHSQMNEEMYITPGIHYSYSSGFDTLARSRKNAVRLIGQSNTAISEARVSDG